MAIKPTESELEILQLLWTHGPLTVRQVNEHFNQKREVGYTTTLKIMQIMAEKGLVSRDTSARKHIYSAACREEEVQTTLLDEFVSSAFRGSASKLVIQLLERERASDQELHAIRQVISRYASENR